jgi:hypothetical protein
LQLGDIEAAHKVFVQSTGVDPTEILGHMNVGTAARLLGDRAQAAATLQRAQLKDKPTSVISVYHQPDGLATISQFLDSLGVGYRFYWDHFSVHQEETVLFATCQA